MERLDPEFFSGANLERLLDEDEMDREANGIRELQAIKNGRRIRRPESPGRGGNRSLQDVRVIDAHRETRAETRPPSGGVKHIPLPADGKRETRWENWSGRSFGRRTRPLSPNTARFSANVARPNTLSWQCGRSSLKRKCRR